MSSDLEVKGEIAKIFNNFVDGKPPLKIYLKWKKRYILEIYCPFYDLISI